MAAAGLARVHAARPRLLEMRRDERVADAQAVAEALAALDAAPEAESPSR